MNSFPIAIQLNFSSALGAEIIKDSSGPYSIHTGLMFVLLNAYGTNNFL